MTNYWEKMDEKLEVQQGKNVADTCKVCNEVQATALQCVSRIFAQHAFAILGAGRPTSDILCSLQCQQALWR